MKRAFRSLLLPCFTLLLTSCAASTKLDRDPARFSVSVNGEPAAAYNSPLVHRVSMTERQLALLLPGPRGLILPFTGTVHRDGAGAIMGVQLSGMRTGNYPVLGLREGDIITAVNTTPARQIEDISELLHTLRAQRTASMTLLRTGRPHKILYYLEAGS